MQELQESWKSDFCMGNIQKKNVLSCFLKRTWYFFSNDVNAQQKRRANKKARNACLLSAVVKALALHNNYPVTSKSWANSFHKYYADTNDRSEDIFAILSINFFRIYAHNINLLFIYF